MNSAEEKECSSDLELCVVAGGVISVDAGDEEAMVQLGQRLGHASQGDATIFLYGNLGMGKTTLCRGILKAFDHYGAVKSPTYTLVEPYELDKGLLYHFDLYRLGDPEELEYLGIRDYFSVPSVRLIEWPDQGKGVLPEPDLIIEITIKGLGRQLVLSAKSSLGSELLKRLQDQGS